MRSGEPYDAIRATARTYEQALLPGQRKQLGQYFTGLPLGKLLAHLALDPDTCTVLDPMAGHGDLLDATWESAAERGIALQRLDGIEIDEATAETCRDRLTRLAGPTSAPASQIMAADAFDPVAISALPNREYGLVITNPPYVRYQNRNGGGDAIRTRLSATIARHLSDTDAKIWGALAKGYSGLADLSVPAWILSAAMVRPGGRLALVVPATWRSRDYADVIRYLLLRCFAHEYIVEDQQPGWFSDALVRTHLVVARRLPAEDIAKPLNEHPLLLKPIWVQVASDAATQGSLVGAACAGTHPEAEFAAWLHAGHPGIRRGTKVRQFDLKREWAELEQRIHHRRWFQGLDVAAVDLPLLASVRSAHHPTLPETLSDILPLGFSPRALSSLDKSGIAVGQGLRTGCNSFFYVTYCAVSGPDEILIEASPLFGERRFSVPATALRPVLRRQAELAVVEKAQIPNGRVLDLRSWILPEDQEAVFAAQTTYPTSGKTLPQLMPEDLATYVRVAADTSIYSGGTGKLIPTLSAVRTNVRPSRDARDAPRFWYMLPDFTPRHRPAAFVPRINHGLPWIESNLETPLLIDANFSAFWALGEGWTRHALKALLNSIWCRAVMEALGTPMGGGALKLEATHLRHMPVPVFSDSAKADLDDVGKQLTRDAPPGLARVDEIVLGALCAGIAQAPVLSDLADTIEKRALSLSAARQRSAS